MTLSIVIPTLDAAASLPATLAALAEGRAGGLVQETIVADGGSRDATTRLCAEAGVRVIAAPRGRGPQLVAGAEAAEGDWLLFLHADSRFQPGWTRVVEDFIGRPENVERAGFFRISFDDEGAAARRVAGLANWRARRLGLPYGDQGLLIGRDFYTMLGGFCPLPLMEDVDMARRIGRARLVMLNTRITTSAERYRKGGWWVVPARNLCLLSGYLLGMPPRILAHLYR
jgi:rSAM/selenodomain-associated transferase 2